LEGEKKKGTRRQGAPGSNPGWGLKRKSQNSSVIEWGVAAAEKRHKGKTGRGAPKRFFQNREGHGERKKKRGKKKKTRRDRDKIMKKKKRETFRTSESQRQSRRQAVQTGEF